MGTSTRTLDGATGKLVTSTSITAGGATTVITSLPVGLREDTLADLPHA